MARLDNFAIELQQSPGATGYLLSLKARRGGKLSKAQEAALEAAPARMKNYLVTARGIDPGQLVTFTGLEGRYNEAQIWIVPPGARPPLP